MSARRLAHYGGLALVLLATLPDAWCQNDDAASAEPGASEPAPNLLANGGFEAVIGQAPRGWDLFLMPQEGAYGRADAEQAFEGGYAAVVHVPEPQPQHPVNNWSQNIVAPVAGKTLHLSGYIRTEQATEAAIWLQCWSVQPTRVIHAATTFDDHPMYGTREWNHVEMTVQVPPGTSFVTCRCVLRGTGTAWFDDLRVVIHEAANEEPPAAPAPATGATPAAETTRPAHHAPASDVLAARTASPPATPEFDAQAAQAAVLAATVQTNHALRQLLAEPAPGRASPEFEPLPWHSPGYPSLHPPSQAPDPLRWLNYPGGAPVFPLQWHQERRR
jgi:hypothetical protein